MAMLSAEGATGAFSFRLASRGGRPQLDEPAMLPSPAAGVTESRRSWNARVSWVHQYAG
jgi:hypothetical protein